MAGSGPAMTVRLSPGICPGYSGPPVPSYAREPQSEEGETLTVRTPRAFMASSRWRYVNRLGLMWAVKKLGSSGNELSRRENKPGDVALSAGQGLP